MRLAALFLLALLGFACGAAKETLELEPPSEPGAVEWRDEPYLSDSLELFALGTYESIVLDER